MAMRTVWDRIHGRSVNVPETWVLMDGFDQVYDLVIPQVSEEAETDKVTVETAAPPAPAEGESAKAATKGRK